ncbi:glycoside hydrolase family 19 protein [Flavobacterium sp. Sr18]|uniref:glycoside hydrolase family 19 protein n=1 Tax=Flavobacterium sp. Sr18 TaxID=935222 RepID=UPI0013E4C2E1|nr:glycoside hydrolase family 19 protein [Flavobacterium sp. Sr18]QIH37878.1 glycoside hydrolase family 19 protein [Flavobacterium sp. Sr18]
MIKIKQFQLQYGLTSDGVIGKKTLNKIKEVLNIPTNEALAHFMGQISHETADFTADTENLNYSAAALQITFKKYFPTPESAALYARQPQKIANKVYANRMGNGDITTNDGFNFRGRGALQLTGKANYKAFSKYVGEDCLKNPDLVASKYFFESAKFYFDNNQLWKYTITVDDASITKISKAINVGNVNTSVIPNGLSDRINKTKEYYQLML